MYCEKCGKQMNDNDKFCISCGTKVEKETPLINKDTEKSVGVYKKHKKTRSATLLIVIIGFILGAISVTIHFTDIGFQSTINLILEKINQKNEAVNEFNTTKSENYSSNTSVESVEKEITAETLVPTEVSSATIMNITEPITSQPTTETLSPTEVSSTTVMSSTESITLQATTEETTVDAGKLFRPSADKFCNQYKRYISGYFEGQDYAKMRFGPSKSKYNVVGQIDNGNIVTVETESIDGWTMVYYEGEEGWVRTDFLFESYEDCFPVRAILPDNYYESGYPAYVDVTGEYDGEPLNMRAGPSRDYELITTVPDGAEIKIKGTSIQTDEWTYVEYKDKLGWVLTKYINETTNIVAQAKVSLNTPAHAGLNMRAEASSDSELLCLVEEGELLDILSFDNVTNGYVNVGYDHPHAGAYYVGWVLNSYLIY